LIFVLHKELSSMYQKRKKMNALLRVISQLEEKQVNGTITMTESTTLLRLIEQAEFMFN